MTEVSSALILQQMMETITDGMTFEQRIDEFAKIFNTNKRKILILNPVAVRKLFKLDKVDRGKVIIISHRLNQHKIKAYHRKTKRGAVIKFHNL